MKINTLTIKVAPVAPVFPILLYNQLFIRHPEFAIMLEAVLKALKTLDSSDSEGLNKFKNDVLSKRNNQYEYYDALNSFCKQK